jgi:hypothetical protein
MRAYLAQVRSRPMTTTPEPPPAYIPFEPQQRPKRRTGRIILIVAGALVALIVAFVLAIVLLVGNTTEDAQKVSDQLITAIQEGDGPAAYALTAPSFRAVTEEPQLTELVKNLSTLVSKDKPSLDQKGINVSTGNGKIAVFVYTLDGRDGKPVYFKTQIRDEEGRWQVMNFRSSLTKLDTEVE